MSRRRKGRRTSQAIRKCWERLGQENTEPIESLAPSLGVSVETAVRWISRGRPIRTAAGTLLVFLDGMHVLGLAGRGWVSSRAAVERFRRMCAVGNRAQEGDGSKTHRICSLILLALSWLPA